MATFCISASAEPSAKQWEYDLAVSLTGQAYVLSDPPVFSAKRLKIQPEPNKIFDFLSADFTGDGYADLIFSSESNGLVNIAISDRNFKFNQAHWWGTPSILDRSRIILANLNADSCTDYILLTESGQSWDLYFSNCVNGFEPAPGVKFIPSNLKQLPVFVKETENRPATACRSGFGSPECYLLMSAPSGIYPFSPNRHPCNGVAQVANFTGRQNLDVLCQELGLSPIFHGGWLWRHIPIYGDYQPHMNWATFADNYNWYPGHIGDFNGDRKEDILIRSDSMLAWWIAVSTGKFGIEIPAAGLPLTAEENLVYSVADVDNNSQSDLLALNLKTSELSAYHWSKVKLLSGVKINSTIASTSTDKNGNYLIPIPHSSPTILTAELPAYSFSSNTEEISVQRISTPQKNQLQKNFVAEPIVPADGSIGQALSFSRPIKGPFVCLGYNFSPSDQGSKWDSITNQNCPQEYATMFNQPPETRDKIEFTRVNGACCRLPTQDILTNTHVYVTDKCPPQYVVTGTKHDYENPDSEQFLRCTLINTTRYQLSPPSFGVTFGFSVQLRNWKTRVDKGEVPLALRFGLTRTRFNQWLNHGCLGLPWGSMQVAKGLNGCHTISYSQLQYRGTTPGDPPSGTPVKMFPECRSIVDPYDPRSGCLPIGE